MKPHHCLKPLTLSRPRYLNPVFQVTRRRLRLNITQATNCMCQVNAGGNKEVTYFILLFGFFLLNKIKILADAKVDDTSLYPNLFSTLLVGYNYN